MLGSLYSLGCPGAVSYVARLFYCPSKQDMSEYLKYTGQVSCPPAKGNCKDKISAIGNELQRTLAPS